MKQSLLTRLLFPVIFLISGGVFSLLSYFYFFEKKTLLSVTSEQSFVESNPSYVESAPEEALNEEPPPPSYTMEELFQIYLALNDAHTSRATAQEASRIAEASEKSKEESASSEAASSEAASSEAELASEEPESVSDMGETPLVIETALVQDESPSDSQGSSPTGGTSEGIQGRTGTLPPGPKGGTSLSRVRTSVNTAHTSSVAADPETANSLQGHYTGRMTLREGGDDVHVQLDINGYEQDNVFMGDYNLTLIPQNRPLQVYSKEGNLDDVLQISQNQRGRQLILKDKRLEGEIHLLISEKDNKVFLNGDYIKSQGRIDYTHATVSLEK